MTSKAAKTKTRNPDELDELDEALKNMENFIQAKSPWGLPPRSYYESYASSTPAKKAVAASQSASAEV